MKSWVPLLLASLCVSCGGSSTGPTPVTPPVTPPAPSLATITGRVTAVNGGQALGSLSGTLGATAVTTDSAGSFSAQTSLSSAMTLRLTGSGIVPRSLNVATLASRSVAVTAIALTGGFDLTFYRELVRNSTETPAALEPLRRWRQTPQIYLKTVDEAGGPIDGPTLTLIEATIADMVPRWTSGALGVPVITRGTDTRVGASGWITIRFPAGNTIADGNCGKSQVAQDGGWVELGYHDPSTSAGGCRVPGAVIAWRTIRHEMGHALGFFHTDNVNDLMYGGAWSLAQANALPSARELAHAAIAYARPIGNLDPDADPVTTVNLAPMVVR